MNAIVEPSLAEPPAGSHVQFERQGYFFSDPIDHHVDAGGTTRVFNKVVGLRDSWTNLVNRNERALAGEPAVAAVTAKPKADSTRPDKLTRAEIRERRFLADPTLRARFEDFKARMGLAEDDAELIAESHALADFFEAAVQAHGGPSAAQGIAKWIVNELLRELKERALADLALTPGAFAALVALVDAGTISTTAGKQVFAELVAGRGEPAAIVARLGLGQVSDEAAIAAATDEVLAKNPDQVAKYRGGKPQLLGFFVGQVMKSMGGRGNPELVAGIVKARLG